MSTFFRQEEVYVTEEELEKTYNYIKNMMDSKISQIQKALLEMQQKVQQKEQTVHPDLRQEILDINTKITETEKLKSKISQIEELAEKLKNKISQIDELIENAGVLQLKIEDLNEYIDKTSMATTQDLSSLNDKIRLMEKQMEKTTNEQVDALDITMQLEQMTEQTANKEQIQSLKEQIEQLTSKINLQDEQIQQLKYSFNDYNIKQNEKSKEILIKLQDGINLQIDRIETETKETVQEKLFEQNTEVQKIEQLLTAKMNKQSEETRNIREEIEKAKLKMEEIRLECKEDENSRVTHYEIEQLNQKLLQIDNALKNSQTKQEINELIEKKIEIKQEELENEFKIEKEQLEEQLQIIKNEFDKKIKIAQEEFEKEIKAKKEETEKENEEKIRKIVEEMLAKQREEQEKNIIAMPQEETTQISQILATIK